MIFRSFEPVWIELVDSYAQLASAPLICRAKVIVVTMEHIRETPKRQNGRACWLEVATGRKEREGSKVTHLYLLFLSSYIYKNKKNTFHLRNFWRSFWNSFNETTLNNILQIIL